MGNLVRDPELKETQNSKVVNFVLAVNNNRKKQGEASKEVVFLDMVAWAEGAETISKFFKKGSPIIVEASVVQDTWTDTEGKNRRSTKYRVNQFWFVPRTGEKSSSSEPEPVGTTVGDEADVPF